ncbi:hypothetical protein Tco_0162114 [Tanacetum coccineum]
MENSSSDFWTSSSGTVLLYQKFLEFNPVFDTVLPENTDSVLSNQRMRPIAPSVPLKLIAAYHPAAITRSATSFLMAA